MKKYQVSILTLILTPIVAGLYGILHDQVSYTISPEYFTKFKFEQFGFYKDDGFAAYPRYGVIIVGFMATW